jgi:two-component system, chemotaxis family, protein-glutamate methylesterase/glutaminase
VHTLAIAIPYMGSLETLKRVGSDVPRPVAGPSAFAAVTVPSIIAIGTSTGGPAALQDILSALPGDLPVPILIVQHMPAGFIGHLAKRLNRVSSLHVHEARQGALIRPGHVYLTPAGRHLTVRRISASQVVLCLSPLPDNVSHIPSVNVLMCSVAKVFHAAAMGIILSGMGNDGTDGMQAIFREGGYTLGQDEATCVVYGMPRSCEERGILREVAALPVISRRILDLVRYYQRA